MKNCGAGAVYGTGGALMNTTDYEVEEGADYEVQQGTEGAGVGRRTWSTCPDSTSKRLVDFYMYKVINSQVLF